MYIVCLSPLMILHLLHISLFLLSSGRSLTWLLFPPRPQSCEAAVLVLILAVEVVVSEVRRIIRAGPSCDFDGVGDIVARVA